MPKQDESSLTGPEILERLGLVGMASIERVVLAALITGDPLLLIGRTRYGQVVSAVEDLPGPGPSSGVITTPACSTTTTWSGTRCPTRTEN